MSAWTQAYDARPTNPLCEREIEVRVVAQRCIYLNDRRVAGGKPFISENLSSFAKKTSVRQVLAAFSDDEIIAYLKEKTEREAYCAGARAYRDASQENSDNQREEGK